MFIHIGRVNPLGPKSLVHTYGATTVVLWYVVSPQEDKRGRNSVGFSWENGEVGFSFICQDPWMHKAHTAQVASGRAWQIRILALKSVSSINIFKCKKSEKGRTMEFWRSWTPQWLSKEHPANLSSISPAKRHGSLAARPGNGVTFVSPFWLQRKQRNWQKLRRKFVVHVGTVTLICFHSCLLFFAVSAIVFNDTMVRSSQVLFSHFSSPMFYHSQNPCSLLRAWTGSKFGTPNCVGWIFKVAKYYGSCGQALLPYVPSLVTSFSFIMCAICFL